MLSVLSYLAYLYNFYFSNLAHRNKLTLETFVELAIGIKNEKEIYGNPRIKKRSAGKRSMDLIIKKVVTRVGVFGLVARLA